MITSIARAQEIKVLTFRSGPPKKCSFEILYDFMSTIHGMGVQIDDGFETTLTSKYRPYTWGTYSPVSYMTVISTDSCIFQFPGSVVFIYH